MFTVSRSRFRARNSKQALFFTSFSLKHDLLLDFTNAQPILRVPFCFPIPLRQLVLRVLAPFSDGLQAVPVGDRDAHPIVAARAFYSEIAGLLRREFHHSFSGLRITFGILVRADGCENDGIVWGGGPAGAGWHGSKTPE